MALSNLTKQQIATQVIRTLYSQFEKFPEDVSSNRNAPFHEAFVNAFSDKLDGKVSSIPTLISLSSWLHGLNTSLGQSFFENTAQILCGGEKKEFTTGKRNNLHIEQSQKDAISQIITDLSNGNQNPSLLRENYLIFQKPIISNLVEGTDFTADVFFENNIEIVCIEIKTVKPNKGVFKVEKQKILEAKAALKLKYPSKAIKYFLAFPFDPLSDTPCGYDKKRFMEYSVGFTKYFDEAEILLSGEFWDFLSGVTGTMEVILEIINTIASPNFMKEYDFLSEPQNRVTQRQNYLILLEKWYLFEEYNFLSQEGQLKAKLTNKKLQNLYNQACFKDGEYKWQRVQSLLTLL
ncbi:TdeIII family type II restriction endonuclease [Thermoflexibacter ruber]|uniref:type II site-specific deoxyribonuclease n=1 Tax=Thermoflexibacter ruber TaxID=1003 RepID=A0A1I2CIQ9_9BACT|nr:TdeIII family type II restriction endonuclease [Thermoflexibacter ruber]SFE68042.1 Type II restriction endonuclease, TdeIII [Thermoflexibacter ruber]